MSNNLDAYRIAEGQNNKYLTANDMAESLDAGLTDLETLDFTSGAITLTETEYVEAMVFKCINVGSALALTLYASRKLSVVWNAGANTVTVTVGSTTVPLGAGLIGLFYTDGTANGLIPIGISGTGGGGAMGTSLAYSPSAGSDDPGTGITGFVASLGSTGTGRLKVTLAGDTTFAGLPAGVDGQKLYITVVAGNYVLTLTAAGSTAGAEMYGPAGGLNLALNSTAQLFYDGGLGQWVIVP